MTQLASDDFAGTGTLGANWTAGILSTRTFSRSSDQAVSSANGITAARYDAVSAPNDQWAQVTIRSPVATSDEGAGPVIRISGATPTFYLAQGNTTETRLYRKTGSGTFTKLGADGPGVADGDVLYLEAQGTSLVVKLNGSTIITATDATLTAGQPGIWSTRTAEHLDDFAFGDFTGGGTVTGTGAATLGAITVAGTAEREVVSTGGAIALAPIVVSGSGAGAESGSGAITLGPIAVAGAAERQVTDVGGSIDLVLPAIVVSGVQGADVVSGAGDLTLGAITVSSTAEREESADGAITLGALSVSGTGKRATDAAGAITLGPLQLAAHGLLFIDGDGAITLGAIEVSGTDARPAAGGAGGDDAPRHTGRKHRGYSKQRALLKLKTERQVTATLRSIYRDLTADPVTRERAQEVVAAPIARRNDETPAQYDARLSERANAFRAQKLREAEVEIEIALRMLHRELLELQQADDEQAIEQLLAMVL